MTHQRLAELFDRAVELAPVERVTWIEAECAGDEELRAQLENLLLADGQAAHFLEKPPALLAAAVAESAVPPAAQSPRRFGPWRVLRSIGVGGMGEVWLSERSDGEFEQRAAIKQLAYPTPGLLQRFRQERQILARLEHANIARLIDGGVDSAGVPYLVMEYVDGVPITEYVRKHALDLRARLTLFLDVCTGVQYAHQNLVVHRDLKPSNIFVTEDGLPKLLDFGIAKVLVTTDEGAQTQTAARMLTPDYAAPEQFNGGAITTATDVYALGVVLYELLADVRPRRAQADPAHSTTELLPPSAAIERTTGNAVARRRALRGDLDRIVLKSLATEPRHRYASAEALASDIRHYLSGRPIAARGDSVWYRFRKYARRNRYMLAATTITFAACLTAAIVSLHQTRLARDEAQRAGAVRQFMVGVLQQANPDENKGKPIGAHQLLEKAEKQVRRRFSNRPALDADVSALLAQLYTDLGDYDRADALSKHAVALTTAGAPLPDDVRGRVLVNLATLEGDVQSKFTDSLAHARQGIALLQAAPERNADDIAKAHWVMAKSFIAREDYDSAIGLLSKTVSQDQTLAGDHSEAVAEGWVKLGQALGESSRINEADAAYDQAMRIMQAIYGPDSLHVAHVLNDRAEVYYYANAYERAEEMHHKALLIDLDVLGPDHPNTLTVRHNLLGDIEGAGRYAEALPQRLQLMEQVRSSAVYATDPIKLANAIDGAGLDYSALGRFDEADALFRQALAMMIQSQGPRSVSSITPRNHLATNLQLQGRYAESDALFQEALAVSLEHGSATSDRVCTMRKKIGENFRLEHSYAEAVDQLTALTRDACLLDLKETDNWRPQVLAALSEAQLDAGDATSANSTADLAMGYARKVFPAHYYKLGMPLFAQARSRLAIGNAAEAEPLLREALAVRSPPHPATDPRVLEVKTALVNALVAQGKNDEARALRAEIEPALQASSSPYAADLLARLATRH